MDVIIRCKCVADPSSNPVAVESFKIISRANTGKYSGVVNVGDIAEAVIIGLDPKNAKHANVLRALSYNHKAVQVFISSWNGGYGRVIRDSIKTNSAELNPYADVVTERDESVPRALARANNVSFFKTI